MQHATRFCSFAKTKNFALLMALFCSFILINFDVEQKLRTNVWISYSSDVQKFNLLTTIQATLHHHNKVSLDHHKVPRSPSSSTRTPLSLIRAQSGFTRLPLGSNRRLKRPTATPSLGPTRALSHLTIRFHKNTKRGPLQHLYKAPLDNEQVSQNHCNGHSVSLLYWEV